MNEEGKSSEWMSHVTPLTDDRRRTSICAKAICMQFAATLSPNIVHSAHGISKVFQHFPAHTLKKKTKESSPTDDDHQPPTTNNNNQVVRIDNKNWTNWGHDALPLSDNNTMLSQYSPTIMKKTKMFGRLQHQQRPPKRDECNYKLRSKRRCHVDLVCLTHTKKK